MENKCTPEEVSEWDGDDFSTSDSLLIQFPLFVSDDYQAKRTNEELLYIMALSHNAFYSGRLESVKELEHYKVRFADALQELLLNVMCPAFMRRSELISEVVIDMNAAAGEVRILPPEEIDTLADPEQVLSIRDGFKAELDDNDPMAEEHLADSLNRFLYAVSMRHGPGLCR